MNFLTKDTNNFQVLWQPVVVQQTIDPTLQRLQQENQLLRKQLEAALANQCSHRHQQPFTPRPYQTDRLQQGCSPKLRNAKRVSDFPCGSPPNTQIQHRIMSNYSPRPLYCQSPPPSDAPRSNEESLAGTSGQKKRFWLSPGQNGRSWLEQTQEEQLTESTWISRNAQSSLGQGLALQSRAISRCKSPLKLSCLPNPLPRSKSPAFLKNKSKENRLTFPESDTLEGKAKLAESHTHEVEWSRSGGKPQKREPEGSGQSEIDKERQSEIDKERQSEMSREHQSEVRSGKECVSKAQLGHRRAYALPTVELSVECESEMSIERVLREKKVQKLRGVDKCDTFIVEMDQKLSNLYGRC